MSAQRQKGTEYENYLLVTYLRKVWPKAERAAQKGMKDFGDFMNVGGWLVEAKKWDRWDLPNWIRKVQAKIERGGQPAPWVILFANDKRKGFPDLVVQPTEQWIAQGERLIAQEKKIRGLERRLRDE